MAFVSGPELYYVINQDARTYYTLFREQTNALLAQGQCEDYAGFLAVPKSLDDLIVLEGLLEKVPMRHQGIRRAWIGYENETENETDERAADVRYQLVGKDNSVLPAQSGLASRQILDLAYRSVEKFPYARQHGYIWLPGPQNVHDVKRLPQAYIDTAHRAHDNFPFICQSKCTYSDACLLLITTNHLSQQY